MISANEVKRIGGTLGVGPTVVDHDYVLGCLLHYLALHPKVQQQWLFKGGTSLRKCYFEGYRFSEDLDFTIRNDLDLDDFRGIINDARSGLQDSTGITANEREVVVEKIEDDYGNCFYEARLYYRGPWDYGGSPPSLLVQVSLGEDVVFAPKVLSIFHGYSDRRDLPEVSLQVYSLEEICAEKLRAICIQRRFAIARDLYDLCYLSRHDIDVDKIIKAFPRKCTAKRLPPKKIEISTFMSRKAEYENNWHNNVEYLIPLQLRVPFEEAWNTSLRLLSKALGQ